MRREIEKIVSALGRTVPLELVAAAAQLSQSAWPEMVERWSRLTPTGFPIELTVTDADPILRWATEIAGPEIVDARRLGLVARRLASAGQPVPSPLTGSSQPDAWWDMFHSPQRDGGTLGSQHAIGYGLGHKNGSLNLALMKWTRPMRSGCDQPQ